MTVQRMDNVGIVLDDLLATIAFSRELGLELEGQARSKENGQGASLGWATSASRIAMMRTPDGHSRLDSRAFSRRLWSPITGTPR